MFNSEKITKDYRLAIDLLWSGKIHVFNPTFLLELIPHRKQKLFGGSPNFLLCNYWQWTFKLDAEQRTIRVQLLVEGKDGAVVRVYCMTILLSRGFASVTRLFSRTILFPDKNLTHFILASRAVQFRFISRLLHFRVAPQKFGNIFVNQSSQTAQWLISSLRRNRAQNKKWLIFAFEWLHVFLAALILILRRFVCGFSQLGGFIWRNHYYTYPPECIFNKRRRVKKGRPLLSIVRNEGFFCIST